MDRILVPLDGSTLAEAVIPVVEVLAWAHQAELLLLRAVAGGSGPIEFEESEAESYLLRVSGQLQDRGLARVRWEVWPAKADHAIAEAATRNQVDLIAMTREGRTGLGRLLLGSVAESVVRQAQVPVLVAHGEPSDRPAEIRQVLVPLDGSELSAAILPVVERLAGPLEPAIHLLHALEELPAGAAGMGARREEVRALRETEAEEYLRHLAEPIEAKGFPVRRAVRGGLAAVDVIQKYAQEEAIDLIAMTTHGRTGLGRLLFGSVAERVLTAVTIPVVLWRPPEGAR